MNFICAMAFLTTVYAADSSGLKPATPDDVAAIQKALDTAKADWDEFDRKKKDFDKASNWQDSEIVRKYRENLQAEMRQISQRVTLDYDKAIHLALAAYGVVPLGTDSKLVLPSGKVYAPGGYQGSNRTWLPFAQMWDFTADTRTGRWAQDKNGKAKPIPPSDPDTAGDTQRDGVTAVYLDKLKDMKPSDLGALLYHERVHFEQLTSPRGADMSRADREAEAYQKELGQIDVFYPYTANPDDKSDPKNKWRAWASGKQAKWQSESDRQKIQWREGSTNGSSSGATA